MTSFLRVILVEPRGIEPLTSTLPELAYSQNPDNSANSYFTSLDPIYDQTWSEGVSRTDLRPSCEQVAVMHPTSNSVYCCFKTDAATCDSHDAESPRDQLVCAFSPQSAVAEANNRYLYSYTPVRPLQRPSERALGND